MISIHGMRGECVHIAHPSNILLHQFCPWDHINISSDVVRSLTYEDHPWCPLRIYWGVAWPLPVLASLEVGFEDIRASRWLLNHGSKSSDVTVVFPFHLSWFDWVMSIGHHEVAFSGLTVTYSFGRGSPSNKSGTTTLNPSWAHSSATNWLWMYSGPKTFVNRMIVLNPLLLSSGLEGGLTIYVRRPCRPWNWPRGVRVFSCESCCQLIHHFWGDLSEHTSYWAARPDGSLFRRYIHLVYSHLTIAFKPISIYGGLGVVDTE